MENSNKIFKRPADTLTIILINMIIAFVLIFMVFSNNGSICVCNERIDAANERMDKTHKMFYDLLKEGRK